MLHQLRQSACATIGRGVAIIRKKAQTPSKIREECEMIVGILKEIKVEENRISMTPAGVELMKAHGHTVLLERVRVPVAVSKTGPTWQPVLRSLKPRRKFTTGPTW